MGVLILGDPSDPHVARVASLVAEAGEKALVFHRFCLDHQASLRYEEGHFSAEFQTEAGKLLDQDIHAVWSRVKPVAVITDPGSEEWIGQEFASKEWGFLLQSLPMLLSQASWVNDPSAQQRLANKPYQLRLAQNVGLSIPSTRITNNPSTALELFVPDREVAFKTLANFVFPPDKYIFTTRISREEVTRRSRAIQRAPAIFQEYIEKDFELRITVVGQQLFATKINSQRSSSTQTDWRRSQLEQGLYEPTELQPELAARIRAFHDTAGLVYGAYDFVVSKEGEPLFLECNPAGQWLWLEELTGQQISRAVASTLVQGGPHR